MKKNYSFVFALFLSMCLLSNCAVSPGTSHGDLSMDSDVPSVAKDFAQQIENNKPMDEGLNVNPSGLDGKVSMTVAADTAGSLDITITNNLDVDIDMGENKDDLRTDLKSTELTNLSIGTRAIDGPTSYRTLSVNGVSQSGNTCWAATCAAIINYYRGYSLSDIDVARYIFGSNWNQGGSWSNMQDAYNHWDLFASQTGVISFSSVKDNINAGDPMHIRLTSGGSGHSVGLNGYEDWVGSHGGGNERILILLEPNGGVHRSVTLNSSGNFNYNLGGGTFSWSKTIEF